MLAAVLRLSRMILLLRMSRSGVRLAVGGYPAPANLSGELGDSSKGHLTN